MKLIEITRGTFNPCFVKFAVRELDKEPKYLLVPLPGLNVARQCEKWGTDAMKDAIKSGEVKVIE